ncbi:hypothetical protein N5580_05070 [Pantoea piersonii]|uniref:Tli3-like domain-containing protein n=1 Tax=Pantoea piersonii TaxID=2364647 RepID=A0AAJ5QLX1_9GAMM|nr:hypothetical protein [Pantoea piersonii]WBG91918.1 hypothetical protein N5580_05070 [Pantoea piersonii]
MKYKILRIIILAGMSCALSGCITGGAAFGLGAGSLHETVMTEKKKNAPPPVYGPPQIIYRIDDNRYFTLENYTRCENGQTFYNNKAKGIHFPISPGSGYLFKGRLFWLSSRDDYLAFPFTRDTNKAVCAVSEKGCKNLITVTVDGGKTRRAIDYGYYTKTPTSDTKDYDMVVTDDGFYMIEYSLPDRAPYAAHADKWTFKPSKETIYSHGHIYPGVTGPEYQPQLDFDVSHVVQSKMKCDRRLEPVQP